MRARWYDPTTARWLSKDLVWDGANRYAFVGNQFTTHVDYNGLEGVEWGSKDWVWPWDPDASWNVGGTASLWWDKGSYYGHATGSGLGTGSKAIVNSGAKTLTSAATLGFKECGDLFEVTEYDRFVGYDASAFSSRISGEFTIGFAAGGLSKFGQFGKYVYAWEQGSNAVQIGVGVDDAIDNGIGWGNGAQIVGGGFGIGGGVAGAWRRIDNVGETLSSQSRVTLYHQGDLSGGVNGSRYLSTSKSCDLGHYNPDGQLHKFEIPRDVFYQWELDGSLQRFNDLHEPTGIVTPEIRIRPPATGELRNFSAKPGE